ncbi:hypothetical protein IMX26_07425 [Clostridium sp. 'deep sea']|uniref:hypothetical protein n=1 Tax=Clostridium sp. 'deep sea' TaxID=2779445 RepID=UPI00189650A9|nr:hypothetical protein [Clostridium sp. 'deep sea']QOR36628.1 hypothetical protein IMX26_07425 [Clostridium sp. 'deep sea']
MYKKLKKEIINNILFVVLGLAFIGYGYFMAKDNPYLISMGIMFAVIGSIQCLIYYFNKNNKKIAKNLSLENEERNVFIRNESTRKAFWIMFFFVLITSNLNYFNKLNVNTYGVVIICVMSVLYFVLLSINCKKY